MMLGHRRRAWRGMYFAMAAVTDRRLFAHVCGAAVSRRPIGFLVSMSNFNAFYNPSIQGALLGDSSASATAIATPRPAGRRPGFNVIYRFGTG